MVCCIAGLSWSSLSDVLVEFVVAELLFWGANVFGFRDGRGVGRGACFRDASDAGEAVGPGFAFRIDDGRSRVGALVKDGRCCCSRIDELVNDF